MIQAFFLSLGQLLDRPIALVFLKSILVTLLLFAGLGFGLWHLMQALVTLTAAWTGAGSGGLVANAATLLVLLLFWWLLFRAVAVAVIGLFADDVVAAVERKHYPAAHAQARAVPFGRGLALGAASVLRFLFVNAVLTPLYLFLLITGIGTALLFFIVNSWLLGRDLDDMVAARHMPKAELPAWRSRTAFSRMALGAIGTGLLLVPILNLVAPVLGAAMATHLFHRGRQA